MRGHISNTLRSFAAALTAAVLGALMIALMLALYDVDRTVDLAVVLLAALLFGQALVNELLCTRNASMLVCLIVNAVLLSFVSQTVPAHTVFTPASSGFPVFLRIVIFTSGFIGTYASQNLPDSNVFVRCSDALIIATALYLAAAFFLHKAFNLPVLAFALLTFVLLMIITAGLRAGGESDSVIRGTGMGGWLVLLALFGICVALAAALLGLAGGHVESLVDVLAMIWTMITRAGAALLELIARISALLIGKPRAIEQQYVQHDSLAYRVGPMEETGAAPEWVVYLIMGLITALIIAGILAILWAMHAVKIGRAGRKRIRRRVTRQSHLLAALKALFSRLAGIISFELIYRLNRRTPQGLFVLARRACRVKLLPKKKSESAGAYLRRLHSILLAQGHASTLDELAAMLDRVLYAGEDIPLTGAQYEAFASQIRAISALQHKSL